MLFFSPSSRRTRLNPTSVEELSHLVNDHEQDAEGQRYKVELHRYGTRLEQRIKKGHVYHDEHESDAGELRQKQPQIAMSLEHGHTLKEREFVRARYIDIAEGLYDDQRGESDRLPGIHETVESGLTQIHVAVGPLVVGEKDTAWRQVAVHAHVEKEHGYGEERLEHAQKEVGEQEELLVDEMVSADDTGRFVQDVALALLEHHGERRSQVRQYAYADHLKGGEGHGHAQVDVQYDGHHFGEGARGQQVQDHFAQILEDEATILDGHQHGVERVVEEHYLGGLHGHLAAAAHGDADVGGFERGRVIYAVACHRHYVLGLLELLDDGELLSGRGAGEHDLFVLDNGAPVALVVESVQVVARQHERLVSGVVSERRAHFWPHVRQTVDDMAAQEAAIRKHNILILVALRLSF